MEREDDIESGNDELWSSFWRDHVYDLLPTVVGDLSSAHAENVETVYIELLNARDAALLRFRDEPFGLAAGDARLLAVLRAYRAIEWYFRQLREPLIDAVTHAFGTFLSVKHGSNASHMIKIEALDGMRDRALEEAIGRESAKRVIGKRDNFFGIHKRVRDRVAHSTSVPTAGEAVQCYNDAAALFNLIEKSFRPPEPLRLEPVGAD